MDFLRTQFGIFLSKPIDRPDLFAYWINEQLMNLFNTTPTITPLPENLPIDIQFDIPIVNMKDSTGFYEFTVSRNRIDFYINSTVNDYYNQFEAKTKKIIQACLQKNLVINRVGLVFNYFLEDKKPIERIKIKYLKTDGNLREIFIRLNYRLTINGIDFNDLVQVSDGEKITNGISAKGVLLVRDINSVPGSESINYKLYEKILSEALPLLHEKKIMEMI